MRLLSQISRTATLNVCLAYGTACNLNATAQKEFTTLTLPADWDGPFGQALSPVATAFVLIIGVLLGSSSIWVVCSI